MFSSIISKLVHKVISDMKRENIILIASLILVTIPKFSPKKQLNRRRNNIAIKQINPHFFTEDQMQKIHSGKCKCALVLSNEISPTIQNDYYHFKASYQFPLITGCNETCLIQPKLIQTLADKLTFCAKRIKKNMDMITVLYRPKGANKWLPTGLVYNISNCCSSSNLSNCFKKTITYKLKIYYYLTGDGFRGNSKDFTDDFYDTVSNSSEINSGSPGFLLTNQLASIDETYKQILELLTNQKAFETKMKYELTSKLREMKRYRNQLRDMILRVKTNNVGDNLLREENNPEFSFTGDLDVQGEPIGQIMSEDSLPFGTLENEESGSLILKTLKKKRKYSVSNNSRKHFKRKF